MLKLCLFPYNVVWNHYSVLALMSKFFLTSMHQQSDPVCLTVDWYWQSQVLPLLKTTHTTKTGRLFFFRDTRNSCCWPERRLCFGSHGKMHVNTSFVLCSSVFPLHFFSVIDLWVLLLVQHDKDKGCHLCFSHRQKTIHFYLWKSPPSPCDFWLASGT